MPEEKVNDKNEEEIKETAPPKTTKIKRFKSKLSANKKNKKLYILLLILIGVFIFIFALRVTNQNYSASIKGWEVYTDHYSTFEKPSNFFIKKQDIKTIIEKDLCTYVLSDNGMALDQMDGFDNGQIYIPYKSPEDASEVFPSTFIVINACGNIYQVEDMSTQELINRLDFDDYLHMEGDGRRGIRNIEYTEISENIYLSENTNLNKYYVIKDNVHAVIGVYSSGEKPSREFDRIAETIAIVRVTSPTRVPTPTPDYSLEWEVQESDNTSEWKKVVNTTHNYSFEIPKSWVLGYGYSGVSVYENQEDKDYLENTEFDYGTKMVPWVSVKSEDLNSGRYADMEEKIKDTQDLFDRGKQLFSISHAGYSAEMTKVAGEDAVWSRICLEVCDETIRMVKGGYLLTFGSSSQGDKEVDAKNEQIRFQIMSNFKFK